MTHTFDDTGKCINPSMEFAHNGKYLTVQITSAIVQGGVVFGYYFRSVRAYEVEACRQGAPVPPEDKKRELKKIIDRAAIFFASIRYDEARESLNHRYSEGEFRQRYEREIAALREKGESLFQLALF